VRVVIVEDASRFARSVIAQELGVLAMQARGVRVLTASGEDLTSTDDPAKIMMRQIAGAFAQYEKARLVAKLRGARDRHAHEIELCYLPSYAPDHNPSEYLNNDLKQKLRQQRQPTSEEELIERTRSVLRAIQRSPERIQAYFKPEPVRYAA
jgi:DNA invertase Pin-like site-specific DNA recombinase